MGKIKLTFRTLTIENGHIKESFFGEFLMPLKKGDLDYLGLDNLLANKANDLWGNSNWVAVQNKGKSFADVGKFYYVSTAIETEGDTLHVAFPPLRVE
jgi:hypothetical protein